MADDIFPEDEVRDDEHLFAPPVATDLCGSMWARLTVIKRSLPIDHEFAKLFHEIVTMEVLAAKYTGKPWAMPDPLALAQLLQDEAIHHGLLDGPIEAMPKHEAAALLASAFSVKSVIRERVAA